MIACADTAQTFMDNVRAEIQTKIQHLNPNDIPTRILYDRTLPLSNILGYGTPSGFAPLVPNVLNSSAGHYFFGDGGRSLPQDPYVVYPVPAKNMITITNTQRENTAISVVLYDMFGQVKTSMNTIDNNSITLGVSNTPEGLYIIKIIAENGIDVIKHISIER